MSDVLKDKIKFGFLHIPTGLILRTYVYDSDQAAEVDDSGDELVFDTKEGAETALSLMAVLALEKKRGKHTLKEQAFLKDVSYFQQHNPNMLIPSSLVRDSIFSHRIVSFENHGTTVKEEWTPKDSHKYMKKFNVVKCVSIPDEPFYRAAGLEDDEQDYDEFKKKTGYALNRYEVYSVEEFEIVEITKGIQVKRPTVTEFRELVFKILKDTNSSDTLVDQVKQYIKD